MSLPFTTEQFLDVFRSYNDAVWPVQPLLIGLALLAVLHAVRGTARANAWTFRVLSILWLWMALAYHAAFFSRVNPAAFVFALFFLLQAAAFAWLARRPGGPSTHPRRDASGAVGWAMVVYALAVYPLVGRLLGHRYPASPTFGLPCPTTIFTMGILAWAGRAAPWPVLVVPVGWAMVGTSAAVQLGMWEDLGLPIAAILLLAVRWSTRRSPDAASDTLVAAG